MPCPPPSSRTTTPQQDLPQCSHQAAGSWCPVVKVQLLQGSRISCRPLTPPPPTTPSLHHTRAGRAARDTSCVPQQCFIEVGWGSQALGISPEHPGVSLLRPAGHQHLPDIVFCFLHAPLQVRLLLLQGRNQRKIRIPPALPAHTWLPGPKPAQAELWVLAGAPTTLQVSHVVTAVTHSQRHRGRLMFTQTEAARAVATAALQKAGAMNLSKEGNQIRSCNSYSLERD